MAGAAKHFNRPAPLELRHLHAGQPTTLDARLERHHQRCGSASRWAMQRKRWIAPHNDRWGNAARDSRSSMNDVARHGYFAVDFGCVSSTLTSKLPARIAPSFARIFATTSAGTFFSKVPSGASSEPLCFIIE